MSNAPAVDDAIAETGVPREAQRLVGLVSLEVDDLTAQLEAGSVTATAWQGEMARTLTRGHLAAYMAGQGSAELDSASRRQVLKDVAAQLGFLDAFTVQIQDAAEFQRGWNARARMYAEAVGSSFYRGRFRMWPLPSVPRDGTTQCLSRCNCSWEIEELEGEGNADAYWRLGPTEHCQTCVERARQWAPLKIREGVVQ